MTMRHTSFSKSMWLTLNTEGISSSDWTHVMSQHDWRSSQTTRHKEPHRSESGLDLNVHHHSLEVG